jgi:hypothetical protein
MNQTFVNQANRAFLVSFLNGRTGISCASSSWLARPFCGTPSPEAPGAHPQIRVPPGKSSHGRKQPGRYQENQQSQGQRDIISCPSNREVRSSSGVFRRRLHPRIPSCHFTIQNGDRAKPKIQATAPFPSWRNGDRAALAVKGSLTPQRTRPRPLRAALRTLHQEEKGGF